MTHLITVTHAKIIQLAAEIDDKEQSPSEGNVAPKFLDYVGIQYLTEAYVAGSPVRGVCGEWFVPTRDGKAPLPICTKCEEQRPVAENVLEMIRRFSR